MIYFSWQLSFLREKRARGGQGSQDTFCDETHSIKVKGNPEDRMSQAERTKLVVDDTTIYEIDLECQECKNRKECEKKEEREVILSSQRPR